MKTSPIKIQIPEPCRESWNNMKPEINGRFCTLCSKTVIDFTNKSNAEILFYLTQHQNESTCGRFKNTQLNRSINISVDLNNLPKQINFTNMFIIALFLVTGSLLFSCKNHEDKKIDEFTISVTDEKDKYQQQHVLGAITAEPEQLSENSAIDDVEEYEQSVPGEYSVTMGAMSIDSYPTLSDETDGSVNNINANVPIIDTVNLDEISVVSYVEPLIDEYVMGNATTGLISYRIQDSVYEGNILSPQKDNVLSVYPNPSQQDFTIKYTLSKKSNVQIDIVDMNGALVKSVMNINNQHSGQYNIPVNLMNDANGIYVVELNINEVKYSKKILIE